MSPAFVERKPQHGFSLIELIIVLVILGMLAGVIMPKLIGIGERGKMKVAKIQITELEAGLKLFYTDVGRYPTDSEGLEALLRNPGNLEGWKGPYLEKTGLPLDPWRKPYIYRSPGQHGEYDLFSHGPDGLKGEEGENADLVSWK